MGNPTNRKYTKFVAAVRNEIVKGRLKPGQRVPSVSSLQKRFATTRMTVLKSIETLVADGYLRTEERRGVFVARHPPHVAHFGVVFPWARQHAPSLFYRAIEAEAGTYRQPHRRITMFHGVGEDGRSRAALERLVLSHRLAGLILAHSPHAMLGSPILTARDLPRVGVMEAHPWIIPMPTVYPDLNHFWQRAMQHLAERRCKRLGIVVLALQSPAATMESLKRRTAPYGFTLRPDWTHAFSLETMPWASHAMETLFRHDAEERPDALIVADDNLTQAVTAGVVASGVSVPRDLEIVSLANFPEKPPASVPVTCIGFDVRSLVRICLSELEQQRGGRKVDAHVAIPAQTEGELNP